MLNTTIEILLLSIVINYVVEVSGFGQELKRWIWKVFFFPKPISNVPDKPFFCPLCLTWWMGLILLIVEGQFNLPMIVALCFVSYLTPITADLMRLVKDLLVKMMDVLNRIL